MKINIFFVANSGAQGISQYGDYVTRVFYEGGEADYTDYVVVSVIKKGEAVRYSNILVAQPDNGKSPCHGVFNFVYVLTCSITKLYMYI